MHEITQILEQVRQGEPRAAAELLQLAYDELRKLAAQKLNLEKPGQTLQATALVNEAYLRLVDVKDPQRWNSRGHFFAAAAEAMRRILVERARRKKCQRQGGDWVRSEFHEDILRIDLDDRQSDRILSIHEALTELEAESPREAQLVKLRFFVGMTFEEAAAVLEVSVPTAKRDWAAARVWLYRRLSQD